MIDFETFRESCTQIYQEFFELLTVVKQFDIDIEFPFSDADKLRDKTGIYIAGFAVKLYNDTVMWDKLPATATIILTFADGCKLTKQWEKDKARNELIACYTKLTSHA